MWLLELIGISLVAGTVLGVSWRVLEDWWNKGEADRLTKKVDKELAGVEKSTTFSTRKSTRLVGYQPGTRLVNQPTNKPE